MTSSEENAALRILVVEDSPINQRMMLAMLSKLGHKVDVADNGEAAFYAVSAQLYELVLMDLQMPVMDGLTASRKINDELPAEKRPYIVALTAESSSETRHACIEAGMDAYLSKPIGREALLATLESARLKAE